MPAPSAPPASGPGSGPWPGFRACAAAPAAQPSCAASPRPARRSRPSLPLGAVVCALLGAAWVHLLSTPDVAGYGAAVWLTAFGAWLELVGEPAWIRLGLDLAVGAQAAAEGAALTVRTAVTAGLVLAAPARLGVLAFAAATVAQGAAFALMCWVLAARVAGGPRSALLPGVGGLDARALTLASSFFRQGLVKQVLTEGERLVMTAAASVPFAEQGVFDVVHNLGSLVARFLFRPVEDSFYVYFARTLAPPEQPSPGAEPALAHRLPREVLARAARTLSALLKALGLAGLTIACFGQGYARVVLLMYGGTALASPLAVSLMRLYAVYVFLLAANGTMECFVVAAAAARGRHSLDRYNRVMVLFSAAYLGLAVAAVPYYGSRGLLAANCASMTIRIAHHVLFIRRCVQGTGLAPLRDAMPPPPVLALFAAALGLTLASDATLCCDAGVARAALHVAMGAFATAACVAGAIALDADVRRLAATAAVKIPVAKRFLATKAE